ncbi:MAG TPA: hypothetical protein VIS48_00770 [Candidatus Kryptonia bacterium]
MTKILLALPFWVLLCESGFAQYPFEKYKAPPERNVPKWVDSTSESDDEKFVESTSLSLNTVFPGSDKCDIRVEPPEENVSDDDDISKISIFRNDRLVQTFVDSSAPRMYFSWGITALADYNGDGLTDIRIVVPYMTNGLGLDEWDIYLIQNRDGHFTKIAFHNLYSAERPERDMDNDGHFVVIGMELEEYKEHNYFVYNLYKFSGDSLLSVSDRFGYPLMYRFLKKTNYKVAKDVPDWIRSTFLLSKPKEYTVDEGTRY